MRCTAKCGRQQGGIMNSTNKKTEQVKKLVLMALLTALVAVLAYLGGFIKLGSFASINLTLVPVVVGAALYGPAAGAWLGGVSAATFFLTADSAFWLGLSIPGTIITVFVKGIMAGLCAGLVFNLLKSKNKYLAVLVSAIVAPVVNTGIFLLGCLVFFMDTVSAGATAEGTSIAMYLIVAFVGLNFVFELIANIVVSPAIVRILDIAKKRK